MELWTLTSSFQPDKIVENYESLIWTERYSESGDFEISSSNILELITALPLESFVTLRESSVPMVVESWKIEKGPRKPPKVTITGRSFETVLERRVSANTLNPTTARSAWMVDADKESDAAYLAMRIVLGDVARFQGGITVLPANPPAISLLDAIPEIDLTLPADYVDIYTVSSWSSTPTYNVGDKVRYQNYIWQATASNTNYDPTVLHLDKWQQLLPYGTYEIKLQNLYNTVKELIITNHRGLKAVRPDESSNKVGIEIYNGADLTNILVLDVRFDQVEDANYLMSKQGSTNVAYVYSPTGAEEILKNAAPEPSGLSRRVMALDLSNESSITDSNSRRTRGLIELYKYNVTAMFDGQVADQIAAGYNRDYFLGDILRLDGEFGLSLNVRVTEFIRSSDSSGQKAYPAFEAIDDV